jgi:hypothetical protein
MIHCIQPKAVGTSQSKWNNILNSLIDRPFDSISSANSGPSLIPAHTCRLGLLFIYIILYKSSLCIIPSSHPKNFLIPSLTYYQIIFHNSFHFKWLDIVLYSNDKFWEVLKLYIFQIRFCIYSSLPTAVFYLIQYYTLFVNLIILSIAFIFVYKCLLCVQEFAEVNPKFLEEFDDLKPVWNLIDVNGNYHNVTFNNSGILPLLTTGWTDIRDFYHFEGIRQIVLNYVGQSRFILTLGRTLQTTDEFPPFHSRSTKLPNRKSFYFDITLTHLQMAERSELV